MIEFHAVPDGGRWQVRRGGDVVAVYNCRDEALHQTCELARVADGSPTDTYARIVLHNTDGQKRHVSIPRSHPGMLAHQNTHETEVISDIPSGTPPQAYVTHRELYP